MSARRPGLTWQCRTHPLDGSLQFVHVRLEQGEVGEEEFLKALVLLLFLRQADDDADCDHLPAAQTRVRAAAFV